MAEEEEGGDKPVMAGVVTGEGLWREEGEKEEGDRERGRRERGRQRDKERVCVCTCVH